MHTDCGKRWFKFGFLGLVGIAVAGLAVMFLWNWLTPALFGWQHIGFLQALGLLVLARLLFGGFRGRPCSRSPWRRQMEERWEEMTPEERENFQIKLRCCWGKGKSEKSRAGE
jgi:hypothetical protein